MERKTATELFKNEIANTKKFYYGKKCERKNTDFVAILEDLSMLCVL